MARIYATLPSEHADLLNAAADTAARRAKADGDYRTLTVLRVAFLVDNAVAFLTGQPFPGITVRTDNPDGPSDGSDDPDGGEPNDDGPNNGAPSDAGATDDAEDTDGEDAESASEADTAENAGCAAPRRHGRTVRVGIVWDLPGLLGLTDQPGLLIDSGATLLAPAIRELLTTHGVRLRRLLHDDASGQLLDLTPRTWAYGTGHRRGRTPYLLDLSVPAWLHHAITTGDTTGLTAAQRDLLTRLTVAIASLDRRARRVLTQLLAFPVTADDLDATPDAETPSPALAEFSARHAGHPANPAAGPTPAAACDHDHNRSRRCGGKTVRANLAPLTRTWHRLKTHGGWTLTRHPDGRWQWTSPTGHHHTVEPHDYRLGP
jgi:hypothetical protein